MSLDPESRRGAGFDPVQDVVKRELAFGGVVRGSFEVLVRPGD